MEQKSFALYLVSNNDYMLMTLPYKKFAQMLV